jgi:hypothetical protein
LEITLERLGARQKQLVWWTFGSVEMVYLQAGSICEQARNASGADFYVVPHSAHLVNMVRSTHAPHTKPNSSNQTL